MEELVLLRLDLFEKLQGIFRDAARHKVNREAAKIEIEILENKLQNTKANLSRQQEQLSQLHNITSGKKNKCNSKILECKEQIPAIAKHLENVVTLLNSRRARIFPTIVDNILPIIKGELDELNASLKGLNEILSSFHDGFIVVRNMVPENTSRILLDFDDPSSPEATLKAAIFDKNPNTSTISAVASGIGGVGKTCALRGIGRLKEAILRFPDGILYMSLGSDATKQDLIGKLAEFVKCSGGENEGIEIDNEKDLKQAIHKASEWFRVRICLFLVDDIWCRNGIPQEVTYMLKSIASHNDSRVAFTTRDRELDCDVRVAFKNRKVIDSRKLLMYTSGLKSQEPPEDSSNAIMSLIQISGGLPIALSAIGCRARELMDNRDGVNSDSVWRAVLEQYETAKYDFPMIIRNKEKDELVFETLYLSVKMIGDGSAEDQTENLFRAFCVIKKRQVVPTKILGRLWGMSEVDATKQVEKFERFSIVEISLLAVGGHRGYYFVVHDLLLDVAKHLVDSHINFAETVSKRIVYSYAPRGNALSKEQVALGVPVQSTRPSSSQSHAIMTRQAWRDAKASFCESWVNVPDDGFAHSNVFRLLGIANMHAEGFALLRDPRWIAQQLKSSGWKQIELDILIILQHNGGDAECYSRTNQKTFLKMLRATVIECGQLILNSGTDGGVWTQLYGRLWHYKRHNIVSQFLNDIETHATRPWYKSAGALPSPKASVQRVLRPGHWVEMVRDSGEEIEMYGIDRSENFISLQVYSDDIDDPKERRRWAIPFGIEENRYWVVGQKCRKADNVFVFGIGHTLLVYCDSHPKIEGVDKNPTILGYDSAEIRCMAANRAGTVLVTGHDNGNVNIWRCAECVWTPTHLEGHKHGVNAVAISDTENHIASASHDRTIRVWSFPFGEEQPSILHSDSGSVLCLSFMRGGNSIVSGSFDGTVTVWSLVEDAWKAAQLHGHTDAVGFVSVSESESFIVSGSFDTTVRVWEENSGTWKARAVMNHSSQVVRVAINEKKNRVVSACLDKTVAIHELGEENWATEEFGGHDGWIICHAGSNGGNKFATGGRDGKVQVSEWTGHAWKSITLDGPGGSVTEVAFSNDGKNLRATNYDDNFVFYVKKDGEWKWADVEDESKFEKCDDFEFLEGKEWPGGFEKMDGWREMWKLPSNYYGVLTDYKPNVSYVEHVE